MGAEDERPDPRPEGGYFEEDNAVRPLKLWYLDPKTCRSLAKQWASDRNALKSSQLRRFFNHCAAIRQRLNGDPNRPWEAERASFHMLPGFAAESVAKEKAPMSFGDFLSRNVEQVRSREDFLRGFMPHFEAVVGFSALYIER